MTLLDLVRIGVVDILKNAASNVEQYGFNGWLPLHSYSGEININGAVALACGASLKDMKSWDGSLEDVPINSNRFGLYAETIKYLEAFMDEDINSWSETATTDDALSFFNKQINRLEIAII